MKPVFSDFSFFLESIFDTPKEVIRKAELYCRICFKNVFEFFYFPVSKAFNGSGGGSSKGSFTLPDEQHIPSDSNAYFKALQNTHI